MNYNFFYYSIVGIGGAILLNLANGAEIRGEVSAWVTLIASIAVTLTTIGIQVYHLIRDRNEDKKKKNQPAEAENEHKENDEK